MFALGIQHVIAFIVDASNDVRVVLFVEQDPRSLVGLGRVRDDHPSECVAHDPRLLHRLTMFRAEKRKDPLRCLCSRLPRIVRLANVAHQLVCCCIHQPHQAQIVGKHNELEQSLPIGDAVNRMFAKVHSTEPQRVLLFVVPGLHMLQTLDQQPRGPPLGVPAKEEVGTLPLGFQLLLERRNAQGEIPCESRQHIITNNSRWGLLSPHEPELGPVGGRLNRFSTILLIFDKLY
mmetsp:Transcript_25712/g.67467  ORF Transcript_25712/g.67467 Transcript_25712/m.67467 type:complete len:233 (+) Transcript_25712:2548-3246(+)